MPEEGTEDLSRSFSLLFGRPGDFPAGDSLDGAASFELRSGEGFCEVAPTPILAPSIDWVSLNASVWNKLDFPLRFDSNAEAVVAVFLLEVSVESIPNTDIFKAASSAFCFESGIDVDDNPKSVDCVSLTSPLLVLMVPTEGIELMLDPVPIDPTDLISDVENDG